ncbi:MAG: GTP cyclohydrolase II [Saprospiraceae bacterium]|jgi:GTP cyclohydrolase II|nr:GTP cyclohydrolase II [Chitinophagia bacterium]
MQVKNKINRAAEAIIPSDWGEFQMIAYKSESYEYSPDIAMVHPDYNSASTVTVRIHSECITGDLFHSQRCDCGIQLDLSMDRIHKDKGVLIYLRQEGRGIGLINKLKAYNKQDEGLDTIEANLALGLDIDYRKYQKAIDILEDLGIKSINLLTNNPDKIKAFGDSDISIEKRIPLEVEANKNNRKYLQTKKTGLGHFLNIGQ